MLLPGVLFFYAFLDDVQFIYPQQEYDGKKRGIKMMVDRLRRR